MTATCRRATRLPFAAMRRRLSVIAACLAAAALTAPAAQAARAPQPVSPALASGVHPAFTGQAMWIWQVPRAERGDLAAIARRAKRHGITAVYVKSGDGAAAWRQFTRPLVDALRSAGLRVCAWHFVYGRRPTLEARATAAAARRGAECLIIDAETQYEGRYASARTYIKRLRDALGDGFPLALTSFPYVDLHPRFPYSVFLGRRGAQVNMPQVYWKDIGDRVDASMARTFRLNRTYGRPIHPIGQLYQAPRASEVVRFRRLAAAYAAPGLSWWEWAAAPSGLWPALATPLGNLGPGSAPDPGWPELRVGARGDLVVRAQWYLRATGRRVPVSARLDAATARAIRGVQRRAGRKATGTLDAATWQALIAAAGGPDPERAPLATTPAPAPSGSGGTAG